jgi:DNA-directed RNA polymerase II subunit RPB11
MIKVNKVNVKIIDHSKELGNSRLDFKISGSNINYIIANTIIRTIFSDIPVYAFNEFKFEKNTSVFHNNYLKLRLRHMPVWGIENKVEFIDYNIKTNNDGLDDIQENNEEAEDDNIELNVEKNLNTSNLKQFTMYVNVKNNSNDIITVSTAQANFYYDETQIKSPYKTPIPIVKLQPGQEIIFSAITKIGTEHEDAMFSAACIAAYKEVTPTNFEFFVESRGQLDEKRIMYVAMINIERRMRYFLKLLQEDKTTNKLEDSKLEGEIIVNNEDHTLGNLIARGLQLHPKVAFAGYNLPHPLAKKVHFHYKLEKSGDIKQIIKEVIDYYSDIFSQIKSAFE